MSNSTLTVANEIRRQIGGSRFAMMTGANSFMGGENFLSFRLPKFEGLRINYVRITLDPSDTYTVEFSRVYGGKYTVLETVSDVYCDTLRQVFESATGLRTSL